MPPADPEPPTPAEAFSTLGNEHRISILLALLEQLRKRKEYPTSFSTLRREAEIEDSGKFNYHLDALSGHFLRQTDDGYEFRYAGWAIVTAILAGTYTDRGEFGPADIEGACPHCGTDALLATYREEWLSIECDDCGERLTRYTFPPGGVTDRPLSEAIDAFDSHVRSHIRLARDGVCPGCRGAMEPTREGEEIPEDRPLACVCTRCGNRLYPPPGLLAIADPDVRAFCREHGLGVEGRFWELAVVAADPPVREIDVGWFAIDVEGDGETLRVAFDDDLTVRSTERRPA